MLRVKFEQAIEAIPTSGCTLVVASGHLLHGVVEQVLSNQDEGDEVMLRVGGKEIFIPVAEINAVAPLDLEYQIINSNVSELPEISSALIESTHDRARELEYSIQEDIGVSFGESGYESYKAESVQPTEPPSFPARPVYFEHDYIEEWQLKKKSRFNRIKNNMNYQLKLSLLGTGFDIGYDPEQSENDTLTDMLTVYLDEPEKHSIETLEDVYEEKPEDGPEPVVVGYLEVIESDDSPLRLQDFGKDEERIGVLIKADQESLSSERCLVAWFKPESIAVQRDRIEALDAIDSTVRLRGSVWEGEWEISDGSETLFPKHNMLVRAGAFVQS